MKNLLAWFTEFSKCIAEVAGHPVTFSFALLTIIIWSHRAVVWVQRHLAASDQHWNYNRHFSDGISHPENAEPRHSGTTLKA